MRNVEIKAVVRNLDHLKKLAQSLSGNSGVIIKQHDTFYKVPQGRMKLRKFEDGTSELIYYERPDVAGPKTSSFNQVKVTPEMTEALHTLLCNALGPKGVVKKVRHLYSVGQTRIHVDCVEDLGDFLELEVALRDDQTAEEGEIIANELMRKLGIEQTDLLAGAYTDLLNK